MNKINIQKLFREQGRQISRKRRRNKQLHITEQHYYSLIENNPDAICTFTLSGELQDANPATEEITGYSVEELRGISLKPLIFPEYIQVSVDSFYRAIKGESQTLEVFILHKCGHRVALSMKYVPIIVNTKVAGVHVIARDISKRIKAEEELRIAKQDLQDTVRQQQGMTFKFIKKDNRFIHTLCDGELMYRMGIHPDQMIGKELRDIFPQQQAEEQEKYYERAWSGEENVAYEGLYRDIHYVASLRAIKRNQVVTEVIGSCVDITHRKKMEEKWMESEKRLRTLINAMPDIICFKDEEGRWVEANDFLLQLFQLDDLAYQGLTDIQLADICTKHQQFLLYSDEMNNKAWEVKGHVRSEDLIPTTDGSLHTFDMVRVPLFHPDGSRKGLVMIGRDITERKLAEHILIKSEKLSAVGQLAAGIAHEIRNPLTTLKGFIQLLKTMPHANMNYFNIMESELDRMNSIVGEFLILAKPQAENFMVQDVRELVDNIITLLETQAIIHNVQIVTKYALQLSLILCNQNQMKQVFLNILKNSIEAMPDGGVIEVRLQAYDHEHILIRFIDQGSGIPEELIPRIGEPFYTTKEKGTGLGLMVTYKIVELHNGKMMIQSKKGEGTTVDLIFPIHEA